MKKYIHPKIKKIKLKVNYFYSNSRYLDSLNMFQSSNLLSASWQCVDTCFMPGTKILLENGDTKEIQEIKVNDTVLSYNLVGQETTKNSVATVTERTYIEGYLEINKVLKITLNHKVWVNNSEWIEAREVKIGDSFLNSKGQEVKVRSIKHIPGEFTVYNLHLNGEEHNFFAEDVLVHNGQGECS